jgi:hypothetical protein
MRNLVTFGNALQLKDIIRPLVPKPLRAAYHRMRQQRASQSDESPIIERLAKNAPRTFIEIGFYPTEFNCASLARTCRGLLIDGNPEVLAHSKGLPRNLKAVQAFLTLDNLDFIKNEFAEIGVLSIDIDGNDYWLLKALIEIQPAVICVEYNATLGFRPITVPYDSAFDRHEKHPSGWYHGASITAMSKLAASRGYGLAAVSEGGLNAFFTKDGKLDHREAWRPNKLREQYSGVPYERQWEVIQHMPFIEV